VVKFVAAFTEVEEAAVEVVKIVTRGELHARVRVDECSRLFKVIKILLLWRLHGNVGGLQLESELATRLSKIIMEGRR